MDNPERLKGAMIPTQLLERSVRLDFLEELVECFDEIIDGDLPSSITELRDQIAALLPR